MSNDIPTADLRHLKRLTASQVFSSEDLETIQKLDFELSDITRIKSAFMLSRPWKMLGEELKDNAMERLAKETGLSTEDRLKAEMVINREFQDAPNKYASLEAMETRIHDQLKPYARKLLDALVPVVNEKIQEVKTRKFPEEITYKLPTDFLKDRLLIPLIKARQEIEDETLEEGNAHFYLRQSEAIPPKMF
ncbi:MAG: hypothetical protein WCI55_17345 [Armatimonadota bacterium]